ncbi:MAG: hypothetical protein ACKKL5_03110 [Candidatus Komeilibacteria bacterium]
MDFNKRSIRLVQQCPVCNRQYQENRVQIIAEDNNTFLAYMTCHFCQSNIIVRVFSLPQGLVGSAILTDLAPTEVLHFMNQSVVSANDVLAVHQLTRNGRLWTLLRQS